ncbi:ABC transporter substrate-binding protein [Xanthobacteraceae bacterium A53D]
MKIATWSVIVASVAMLLPIRGAGAQEAAKPETIKLGLSVPLSGAAANWGRSAEWLCRAAAKEVADAGGVKVGGKTYNFECIAYDNKYNAADGAKVAQTLVNKEQVKFISHGMGTAPVRALQSLTERNGILLFNTTWGTSIKGPDFPLTFTLFNTSREMFGPLMAYIKAENPDIKTVVILNPNDATGQEAEPVIRAAWEAVGVKVLGSDWYERGTTEFQPIAAKLAAMKPDAVDLGSTPPGDAGSIFKELKVLNWKGVQIEGTGTGPDGLVTIGGDAANGTYLGSGISFEGKGATEKQKRLNAQARSATGENLNAVSIGSYDAVYAIKAGIEHAQNIDPRKVAAALPKVMFESFYGPAAFGGAAVYGSPQNILVPVIISQIQDGKLVELERVVPDELKQRLAGGK